MFVFLMKKSNGAIAVLLFEMNRLFAIAVLLFEMNRLFAIRDEAASPLSLSCCSK